MERVRADGKHLALDGRPWRVKGVTYGSFLPRLDGEPFPERSQLKLDLAGMVAMGLNTVRTYAAPPVELLDIAEEFGMRVVVGLDYQDWRYEAHADRSATRRVLEHGRRAVATAMERCAGRPEVLAISIGNEVPGDVVRVHGIGRVQRTLSALAREVHAADPDVLVTYGNFPTTEYLRIDGLDFASFNVFLETPDKLRPYLRHLQVVAGDKPLVASELGLAAGVHGEPAQAASLGWQLQLVDEAGCAGATVFSWTDEWGVAGSPVEGWDFGITTTDRVPKPAAEVVGEWARSSILDVRQTWPLVSVVVCAYNEQTTIEQCLASLEASTYPALEVLVCDDGSTDRTLELVRRFPFRVLELPHGGLSAARNAGLAAARGDIVAYLDADAMCHPDWPFHLAMSLEDEGVVATGGPNLPFADAGLVEHAVAASPGGPVEVLIGDDRAEHVPGCNMAFRAEELRAIGGFDVTYTSAGDDVDVCWKLLDRGGEIAFAPAAQVRHHRRRTVGAYLRQQRGYGRSERMVAAAHPHRFNRLGQATWRGAVYGGAALLPSLLRPVIYHGYQGHAPYQGIVRRRAESIGASISALLPLAVPLAAVAAIAAAWAPAALVVDAVVVLGVLGYAGAVAAAATPPAGVRKRRRYRAVVAVMHLMQPFARVWGRCRRTDRVHGAVHAPEWYGDRSRFLKDLEVSLRSHHCAVRVGPPTAAWDLEAVLGPFVSARITTAVTWNWTPHHRVALGPRIGLWRVLAGAGAISLFSMPAAAVLVAGVLGAAAFEAITLHRALRAAVDLATGGAGTATA